MTKDSFGNYIENFEFSALFNELGWNNFEVEHNVETQGTRYTVMGIAQKMNVPVLQCVRADGSIPEYSLRKQLEKQISKLYFDHLLVFTNKTKTEQQWQIPLREEGKLKRLVAFTWRKGQDAEGLFQKLRNIVFTLDEEDIITLTDVKERVNTSFAANSEKVTKKFYAEFVKQHDAFLAFIKGIDDAISDKENFNKKWYASLMLNRLMFCYFIQKKRFLDWNDNYLQVKLEACKKLAGKDNFYGFYRSFLLELFHDALANPEEKRKKKKHPVEFGAIPYLNGGLFEVHELETRYQEITIRDEAFEKIFGFFDEWEWHLDTRTTATGKDINPDVIGYIFEKYINNRADMGAYYTKEDITDYIGKNTIIPSLLEKVKSWYPAPFAQAGGFWQYLQDSGDEYIYDAVKHGAERKQSLDEVDIPDNIRVGIDTQAPNLLERRKYWNTWSPNGTNKTNERENSEVNHSFNSRNSVISSIGLPTEIWRETIARLERYFELRQKIKKGGIQEINDIITYNLNIRRLVEDYLEQTADKAFIHKFYKALISITILDPTCGSGAFLFAALNILEPLYEVCLQRMEEWYNDNPKDNKDFESYVAPLRSVLPAAQVTAQAVEHPSRAYYMYKTIILSNLYGVDLMREAVEIAKLRLFLKLVAEVDPSRRKKNCGLEPLPDIDFNIRSGNTLVGFATEQQLEEVVKTVEGSLVYKEKLEELKMVCGTAAMSFEHFKKTQMVLSSDSSVIRKAKQDYAKDLQRLTEKLNRYLADTYGLGSRTQWKSKKEKETAYTAWQKSHQPFHWFAEFYEIISNGGFDVVIGNPPYVEYGTKLKNSYTIKGYKTLDSNNLHAFMAERGLNLLSKYGLMGLIVPLPSINTARMQSLQNIIKPGVNNHNVWISAYDERPSNLFSGVDQRLIIEIIKNSAKQPFLFTTGIMRWYSNTRDTLFNLIKYTKQNSNDISYTSSILKIKDPLESFIMSKFYINDAISLFKSESLTKEKIYYRTAGGRYWKVITNKSSNTDTLSEKLAYFKKLSAIQVISLLSSSTFWWYYSSHYDMFNLKDYMIFAFRFSNYSNETANALEELGKKYLISISENSENKLIKSKTKGVIEQKQYVISKSKPIIDEIDKVLAKHYGFSAEELDFIINYDIKYRMGSSNDANENE